MLVLTKNETNKKVNNMIKLSTIFLILFIIGIISLVALFVWSYKNEKNKTKKQYFVSFVLDFLFFDAEIIVGLIIISFVLFFHFKNN